MSQRPPQPPSRLPDTGRRPEPSDIHPRPVVIWAAGLVIASGLLFAAVTVMLIAFMGHVPRVGIPPVGVGISRETPTTLPPEPRLESAPGVTAEFVRAREDPILNSYGWVDQKKGIARIPIQQAITVLAQKGLPARPANAAPTSNEGRTIPSYTSSGRFPILLNH